MSRFIISRLALAALLAVTLLSTAALAQSQDTQSVADAARRARDQKKPPAKPAKVITDEDIKPAAQAGTTTPASPDAAAATSAPASSASSTATPASAPAANSSSAPDAKDQKDSKEVTELKAQIKQALDDLNLVLREQSLENDKYYSNTDYVHDTAGKAKLDELLQQATDKQQVLDRLKTHLAQLLPPQDSSAPAPPKP
jgi:enamine deaminase RidA (YjgF/YER057c/UK114 family)